MIKPRGWQSAILKIWDDVRYESGVTANEIADRGRAYAVIKIGKISRASDVYVNVPITIFTLSNIFLSIFMKPK